MSRGLSCTALFSRTNSSGCLRACQTRSRQLQQPLQPAVHRNGTETVPAAGPVVGAADARKQFKAPPPLQALRTSITCEFLKATHRVDVPPHLLFNHWGSSYCCYQQQSVKHSRSEYNNETFGDNIDTVATVRLWINSPTGTGRCSNQLRLRCGLGNSGPR